MYNFQVPTFPEQDNFLDDITETSMDSNLDASRSFFKNVFHNPLKDDSQLKEGRSFHNQNNDNKMPNNVINNQTNQFYSGLNYPSKEPPAINQSPTYEAKENKFLMDNFLSTAPSQNFDYNKNNYLTQNPPAQSSQPMFGFSQNPATGYDFASLESRYTGNFGKEIPTNTFQENKNQNMFLQDISAVDPSLNESNIKPMMNNPYGQNKSFNKSNLDLSRSNLDNSAIKGNFVELGQKQRDDKREYFYVNVNQSFQNQNLNPRPLNLEVNTSNVTEDTKDLSHLSIGNFKQAFPQKDNSYMLNTSKVNQSNISKKAETDNRNFNPQSYQQNVESQAYTVTSNPIVRSDPAPIPNNASQFRYTGDFGTNYKSNFSAQPVDLLTLVNTNTDVRNPNIANIPKQTENYLMNPAWNEKMSTVSYPSVTNYFNSVQTIPKQSTADGRATEVKEIQGLLAGLESLELSGISAISDSFMEDEEDNKQRKSRRQNPSTNKKSSPVREAQDAYAAQNINRGYQDPFPQPKFESQAVYDSNIGQKGFQSSDPYSTQTAIHNSQNQNIYTDPYLVDRNKVNQNMHYGQDARTLKTAQPEDPYTQYGSYRRDQDSIRPYQQQTETLNQVTSSNYMPQVSPQNRNVPNLGFENQLNYQSLTNQLQFSQNSHVSPRNNFSPRDNFTLRESMGQYPSEAQNYLSRTQPVAVQKSQAEAIVRNQNQNPTKNSQTLMTREYHNPFSDNPITLNKKPANEPRNLEEGVISPKNFILPPSMSNLKTQYGDDPSFPTKVAQEADEIVNQMQGLYKEWKNKNAELNQYMTELSRTSSQNVGERSVNSRSDYNMQNHSLNNFADQRPRQSMQNFSNHANFYLNDKYTSPYEFRYSMQTPKSYNCLQPEATQNYQEFIKEDLLQGLEQPDPKRIGQVKQKFKTFSNPIFKKEMGVDSAQETADDIPLSKRDFQRDSLKLINKIFDTSKTDREKSILTSAKGDANLVRILSSSSQSTPKAPQNIREGLNMASKVSSHQAEIQRTQNERLLNQGDYKLKFKKQDRSRMQDVSMMYDEDLNMTIRDEGNTTIRVPTNKYHQGAEVLKRAVLGFKVKKDRLVEGIDKRKIDPNMEIICINCQEFINIRDVDAHSATCDKSARESHREFEFHGLDGIKDLNAKIMSIKNRLASKLGSIKLPGTLDFRDILRAVDNIVNENDDLETLTFAIKNLEKLLEEVSKGRMQEQELYVLVYLNRILVIAKEKHAEIQFADLDDRELMALENKIHQFETETKKQKAELEIWKYQAQMMNEIKLSDEKNLRYVKAQYRKDNEVLSQIQSDIDYSERGSSYGGTSVTSHVLPLKFDLGVDRSPSEIAKSETQKIRFYSMAVNSKLLLPSSHPGKDILISDLYDECLAENIPEDKWEYFIKARLGFN